MIELVVNEFSVKFSVNTPEVRGSSYLFGFFDGPDDRRSNSDMHAPLGIRDVSNNSQLLLVRVASLHVTGSVELIVFELRVDCVWIDYF